MVLENKLNILDQALLASIQEKISKKSVIKLWDLGDIERAEKGTFKGLAFIHDRALFMKGIDVSYFYEGYSEFRIEDL